MWRWLTRRVTSFIAKDSRVGPVPSIRRFQFKSTRASRHAISGVLVPDTSQGPLIASVDARDDLVSLYAWRDARFVWIGSLATGRMPTEIVSGDLNDDGWDDLVVRNAGDGTLSVFFNANGTGQPS